MRATSKHIGDPATQTNRPVVGMLQDRAGFKLSRSARASGYNTGDVYEDVLWALGRHLQKCAKFARLSRYRVLLFFFYGEKILILFF